MQAVQLCQAPRDFARALCVLQVRFVSIEKQNFFYISFSHHYKVVNNCKILKLKICTIIITMQLDCP